MPTDPTTSSQVQAYRFVLRRMQSALVRKDPVMLHEPMRHHLRATAVGLVLGVLAVVAGIILGHGSLGGGELSANTIVRSDADAVYVAVDVGQLKLIPVPNMTTARLLLAAIAPGHEAPAAKQMADTALARYPRLAASDYPGTPAQLPSSTNLIRGVWSVCDGPLDRRPQPASTVLIQDQPPAARALTDDQAILVAEPTTGATYLLRREIRSQIDLRDPATRNYYRLGGVVPRRVSAGLLNAIPERGSLIFPPLPPARPFPPLAGSQVGDVVRVRGVQDSYYLLLPRGKQQVEPAVADLIRFHHSTTAEPALVTPEAIARVPDAPPEDQLDFAGFPARAPQILRNTDTSAACLTWQDPIQPPMVSLNPDGLPLAPGESPVALTRAANGLTADSVLLKPSKAALVRDATPGQDPTSGTIWLVTDQGVRYQVPSTTVSRELGLGEATSPAPRSILNLLPRGVALDPQTALQQISPELASQLAASRAGG